MEKGQSVVTNQIMQRYDSSNKLSLRVFSMRGDRVAGLYELGGLRLFARNIRGFLGEGTPVNRGMSETLRTEPAHFFLQQWHYYPLRQSGKAKRARAVTSFA